MNQNLFLVVIALVLISCTKENKGGSLAEEESKAVITTIDTLSKRLLPDSTVNKTQLNYDTKTSLWTLNDKIYSGYAVDFYEDGKPKEKIGILNGKKENESIYWYADGHYQQIAHYRNGKLHGEQKIWTPDSTHIMIAHLNYVSGKAHGAQTKWYETGELFAKLNLNMGKEEGLQQAFRKNGALYANYEAKGGRIFGLKKASLCFGLEDEVVQFPKDE